MTTAQPARGVLYLHSVRSPVCPHVEWAVAGVLGAPAALLWTPQPAEAGCYRAEFAWQGEPGTAGRLTSALRGWDRLRFEVTEDAAPDGEGMRFAWTPELGLHHAATGPHGDIALGEDRLKTVLAAADAVARTDREHAYEVLRDQLGVLLGTPWDDELEPFRQAADGAAVRWLHRVG